MIAVAYAFCVLAPTAALAFANSPTMLHCLPEANGMAAAAEHGDVAHSHADEVANSDEHPNKDGKADTGNCCGLFCVSAVAHEPGLTFGLFAPESAGASDVVTGLVGRAPGPLHRPPIA